MLAASGLDPRKIIPVGNPKFDTIPRRSATEDRNHVRARCGAKSGHIFFVATYLFAPWQQTVDSSSCPPTEDSPTRNLQIGDQPHPDEYQSNIEEEQFFGASIVMDVPLYALLNAIGIVFAGSSTVGSEAILFNELLICINLTNTQYAVRYDEEGIALLVEREEEILTTIDKVLHDKKLTRELQTAREHVQGVYALGLDGRSSDRFGDAIKRVTS